MNRFDHSASSQRNPQLYVIFPLESTKSRKYPKPSTIRANWKILLLNIWLAMVDFYIFLHFQLKQIFKKLLDILNSLFGVISLYLMQIEADLRIQNGIKNKYGLRFNWENASFKTA